MTFARAMAEAAGYQALVIILTVAGIAGLIGTGVGALLAWWLS